MEFIDLVDEIVKSQSIYHSILEGNEAQTRWMLIDPLILQGWGFKRNDIIVEYSLDSVTRKNKYNKLDYSVLIKNKAKLLIEAKSLGVNLFEKREQLAEYFEEVLCRGTYVKNELIGILTNGDVYLFYTNSLNTDKMDNLPYYSIQLSVSEDTEKLKLLNYCKSTLVNLTNFVLLNSDDVYETSVSYRVDVIENVFNYFKSLNVEVEIENVHLKGKLTKIKTLSSLYKGILKELNMMNSNLLYFLAYDEDMSRNGKITSAKFSLNYINSSNIKVLTPKGAVFVTIPTTLKGLIERILYLVKISNYGVHNVMISLREKNYDI